MSERLDRIEKLMEQAVIDTAELKESQRQTDEQMKKTDEQIKEI
jgi:hypothetical protein